MSLPIYDLTLAQHKEHAMTTSTKTRFAHYLDLIDQAAILDIGYDQLQRFSYLDLKNGRLVDHSEADCSALSSGLAKLAGYPLDMTPPIWTGTIRERTAAIGWRVIPVHGKTAVQIQRLAVYGGEMLVNETHHVVTQTRRIGEWLSANMDERGRGTGGQAGDQTGSEVSVRKLWNYSHGGWGYLLIPSDAPGLPGGSASPTVTPTDLAKQQPQQKITLSPAATKLLQHALKVAEDGVIGEQTIGAWQARLGTTADRVVNAPSALVEAAQRYVNGIRAGLVAKGKSVAPAWTVLDTDGVWGPLTQAAVEEYLIHWSGAFTTGRH